MMARKKTKKLSTKIALVISLMLVILFSALISVTVLTTRKAIQTSSFGELQMLSASNAAQILQIVKRAENAAAEVTSYMQNSVENQKQTQELLVRPEAPAPPAEGEEAPAEPAGEPEFRSQFFPGITFKTYGMKVEDYLMSTLHSVVDNSNEIVGAGILFEPFVMHADLESFSLYATDEKGVQRFADYAVYSQESYYKDAVAQKKMVFTDPYVYEGKPIITVAIPVIISSDPTAVVIADIDVHRFDQIKSTNEQYPSMYTAILKDNGVIMYESSSLDYIGTNTFEYMNSQKDIEETQKGMASGQPFYTTTVNSTNDLVYKFYDPIATGDSYWYSMTAVNVADVNRAATNNTLLLLVIAGIALLLMLLVVITILKRTLKPINEVVDVANRIAQGDLSVSIEPVSNDEIGLLAASFRQTITSLRGMIGGVSHALEEIANNNLTVAVDVEFKGDFVRLGTALDRILADLNGVMSNINVAADEVSSGSEQVADGAQALSQGATQQASSVQELAATITEISGQVKNNAESAAQASQKADQVGAAITQSNEQMQNMIAAMRQISNSSGEIGKVIKTIEDIAFQTNILALNAAVEAARAGAAGKGFAVVADEVRSLASKSAEAAKGTTALIEGSIRAVENGTAIADGTAHSLAEVVVQANEVISIIDRISLASGEQAQSITQVTVGVDQISAVVQTNSATAEQSAAASEELSGQAQMLRELIGRFRLRDQTSHPLGDFTRNKDNTVTIHGRQTHEWTDSAGKY